MDKTEFKTIADYWISYHNKKFTGDQYLSDEKAYKQHLTIYYDMVKHMNGTELSRGFKEALKYHDYYPKVSQLLKFCPAEKKIDKTPDYKPIPISPASKAKIKNAMAGGSRTQLGEAVIRNNFAMVARRFPNTNWDDALKRELERDARRIKRGS